MVVKKTKAVAKIKVTLAKSVIGRTEKQKSCVIGLGLRKIGSSSVLEKTKSVEGMINKVAFLLKTEEV